MTNKIIAIKDHEHICFKCLKEKPIQTFYIYRNEYGSSFDNQHTKLNICNECKPQDLESWFNEKPEMEDYCANYKYESNIIDFVDTFPLEGKELFWNKCASGAFSYVMDSQDWIDMELGILPDEKYADYGMYSPRQIEAYKEKFPTCEHPVNITYTDGSKGCWCPFGANGEYGQNADDYNYSTECFGCNMYKVRETPIKEMDSDTYEKYEVYTRGKEFEDLFK